MNLQFIICKVLQREAYLCAARSVNTVDVVLMPQGLHNEPDKLRAEVQQALNVATGPQGEPYDASLLGYGLCSNGVVGLSAAVPLVVPRAHDCVTLLLGSKERYRQYFDSHDGIYWYSAGWIENSLQPGRDRYEHTLRQYEEKYGKDNAQYLMEMEQNWMKAYKWATFVNWDLPSAERHRQYTRDCAAYLGWNFDELQGDPQLMQDFVDGKWDEDRFLVVPPGDKIAADPANPSVVKIEPREKG